MLTGTFQLQSICFNFQLTFKYDKNVSAVDCRSCAEEALNRLNGSQLGGQSVRLSWGRTPSNRQVYTSKTLIMVSLRISQQLTRVGFILCHIIQPQVDTNQGNGGSGGYYGYGQGYETYGYAPPAQAPNLYYGGYPGYGNYPQNQQQPQQPQVG